MAKVRQFELKAQSGPHVDRSTGDKIVYEPGEVIHSEKDLCEMFPHKFIEIGVSKRATIKKKKSKLRPSEAEPTSLNDEDEEKIHKKQLKAKQEEIDDEDDDDDTDTEETSEDESAPKKHKKFGKDITEEFETAVKADLKVFTKNGKFYVVDSDNPDKVLPHGKLKSHKLVSKFLHDYQKESK